MTDVVRVVEESSTTGKNKAQLTISIGLNGYNFLVNSSSHFQASLPTITTRSPKRNRGL